MFLVVAVAELSIQALDLQWLSVVIKPLIVISLAAFYFQNVYARSNLFVLALFFCWLGDVFLLFDHINEIYFMAGLGAFLTAHIILIFFYGKLKLEKGNGLNGPQKARVSFPIILAGTGLISILYPTLGALRVPVIVYAVALMIMVLQAIYRYGYTSMSSFWNVCLGALLFMLSDSVLAINKFFQPVAYAGVIVIGTYMSALYFIVNGVISHVAVKDKAE